MKKRSFLSCGSVFVVVMLLMLGALIFGVNSFFDSFKKDVYEQLGFSSQREYDEFVSIFSKDVQSAIFYTDTYNNNDKQYVDTTLLNSISLKDGSSLFLENGHLNIEALDKLENSQLISDMVFSVKQFAYLENLVLKSVINEEDESNEFETMQILAYKLNTETNHSVTLKLNTTKLKESLKEYGEALPSDLYIVINYDIIKDGNKNYKAKNLSIHFNNVDEKVNNEAKKYFKSVLQTEADKVFSDIVMTVINSFNNTLNIRTIFSLEKIRMEAYNEI